MEIKSRIIPAKPRNKELYFLKGTSGNAILGSSSNSISSSASYWKLIDTDEFDLPLENPYILTNYPILTKVVQPEPIIDPENPEAPIESVNKLNYLQIGDARLVYEDGALKVIKENGDPLSFYATGELSAYNLSGNENPENPNSTLFSISNATDVILTNPSADDLLKYNGTKWVNVPMSSLVTGGTEYILPTASATTLGGIKVGQRLSINNGVLSADVQSNNYSLPTASATTLGGIKVGNGLTISSGVLSVIGGGGGDGTVTSVGLSVPVGLTVTGSPITGSGTLALSLTSGYSIPTTAKQGQWDIAYTNNHTHANKALIDAITQGNIDVLSKLSIDANGNLKIDTNAYSTGELSAYGAGTGGGSGTAYERLDSWADYDVGKEGWVLSALLGKNLDTRVSLLEGGSATTVTTTGTGNAITKIEKAGTTITATKELTFAELDSNGKILTSQLPSYVDDVIEATNLADFPATGETGKIYIAQDTNKTYRWSGTAYVEISASLALGTTSSTAFRGDYGNTAYTHSQSEHQSIINGTGFVKANGKTLSYDNSSYSLSNHNHSGIYEPAFTKNSAFNKNFGTTAGTVAQGNDSRFTNSRTPTKKTGTISAALTTSVTHGLGSADVIAQVMTTAGEVVECNIVNTSTTTTFSFNVAPAANTYKYVIIG